jgi:hypothetical protein
MAERVAELLSLDGDDALLAELHTTAQRIIACLSHEEMIHPFKVAHPVA